MFLSAIEGGLHRFEYLIGAWQLAQKCKHSAIDYNLVIDEKLELAVLPMNHFYFRLQLATNPLCHPDSVET